jgi:hypothetical protein
VNYVESISLLSSLIINGWTSPAVEIAEVRQTGTSFPGGVSYDATHLWLCMPIFLVVNLPIGPLLSGIHPTTTATAITLLHDHTLSPIQANEKTSYSPPPPPFRQPGVLTALDSEEAGRLRMNKKPRSPWSKVGAFSELFIVLRHLHLTSSPSKSSERLPSIVPFSDTELIANLVVEENRINQSKETSHVPPSSYPTRSPSPTSHIWSRDLDETYRGDNPPPFCRHQREYERERGHVNAGTHASGRCSGSASVSGFHRSSA